MSLNVGIDLGLRGRHQAALVLAGQVRGRPFSFAHTKEGIEELLTRARAVAGQEEPLRFVMEPTGLAWLSLSALLRVQGHEVFVVKPQKVKDLRRFLKKNTKTDTTDAITLGTLLDVDPAGSYPVQVPSAQLQTLKSLVKNRERVVRQVEGQKKRILSRLDLAIPGVTQFLGEDKFTKVCRAFMEKYLDPQKVVALGEKKFRTFWLSLAKGEDAVERAEKVFRCCQTAERTYRELRQSARGLPFDYAAMTQEIGKFLRELDCLKEHVRQWEREILPRYLQLHPDRVLESIPGVGPVVAAVVVAVTQNNILRFPAGANFVSFNGICPRKEQSGARDKAMPITKAGNRLLKKYLYLAADVARRVDPQFAAYYARRYAQGWHHNRIMIALMRKLAWRIYAVFKRWQQAQEAAANDGPQQPQESVCFQLRDPEGKPIEKRAARKLIEENYRRELVHPARAAADLRRRQRGTERGARTVSGRPRRHRRGTAAPSD